MDPTSLTLLVEILDAGNLSQAARKLKMTRANVSYHLTQLERSVGTQLVRRTTRRVEATEVGLRLYQHGLSIRNELLAAREAITSLSQGLRGRVRLSVPSGYGHMVMAEWLIDFKRLYPGIVLQVLFENRVDDLMRDEVDIAVRVMREPPLSLVARELGSVRYVVCAARAYAEQHGMPDELEQLHSVPLIASALMGQQLRVRASLGERRHELTLEPTLGSEHFPFLHRAVLAGVGVGLVPRYVVHENIAAGAVVTSLDEWHFDTTGTHLYMLYMPNRHPTRAARTLIDFIAERAGSTALAGVGAATE
jgi:DNA-binding transcriptional LysR family regulator